MYRPLALSVSLVAITWAASAAADSPNIKGAYGFTGTAACLVAPGSSPSHPPPGNTTPLPNSGFNPNLTPKDGHVTSHSFSVFGIRTFKGDGTGTVKGTTVNINPPPPPPAFPPGYPQPTPEADSADFTFTFTYTVNGDGSWSSIMVPGSFTQTHLTGPRAGETSTVDAIPPIHGMISQDGKTLIAAHITTAVETHFFTTGDVIPQICHRSRVFIKLKDHDDDDHGDK